MKQALIFLLLFLTLCHAHAQDPVAAQYDEPVQTLITANDYEIIEANRTYSVNPINKDSNERLTGHFIYQIDSDNTIHLELYSGVVTGKWLHYLATPDKPIITQAVNFVEGCKHGPEYLYAYLEDPRTGNFKQILTGIIEYDMGRIQHEAAYFPNKKVKVKYVFDRYGKKQGAFTEFYEDGSVHLEGQYIKGKAVGIWKYYDRDGQLTKEVTYQDDVIISVTNSPEVKP